MQNVNSRHLNNGTKEINNLVSEDKIKWKRKQPRKNLIDKVLQR